MRNLRPACCVYSRFNLIASSPALDILKMGKKAGYKIIANVVAEAELPVDPS